MSKWTKVRLGDCCEITSSKRCHLSDRVKDGVPFYRSKEIIQRFNGESIEECDCIEESTYLEIERRYGVPKSGDLLVTTRGSVGVPCLYTEKDRFYFADGNLTWFRNFKPSLNSGYLYYWFQSSVGRHAVTSIAVGTAQLAVPISGLKLTEILLPPIERQRKVSEILSDYDSAIDNARRQIALLEEAAMRLYREWFVVNADPKWEKRRLWDVCDYFRGVSYTSKEIAGKGGVPLITLKNIERFGGFREDRSKTFSGVCKDGSSAGPNDVLMAVTDMTKERRLVGHVAMVPDTYDKAQFSMDLIRLKGKLVSNSFLYAMLRYSTYADEFAVRASGANVLHLKPSSLDDCEVVVPKRGLREKFDFVFVPMTQKKNALYRAILRLTEARDRLLPKLMSGEIEV